MLASLAVTNSWILQTMPCIARSVSSDFEGKWGVRTAEERRALTSLKALSRMGCSFVAMSSRGAQRSISCKAEGYGVYKIQIFKGSCCAGSATFCGCAPEDGRPVQLPVVATSGRSQQACSSWMLQNRLGHS
jgi:hypothetical protein